MTDPPKKERLLVVDDASDMREVLQRNLTAEGYRILTATGVPGAVKILETTSVDLVITDLKMPKVSGLDLVRHVRENLPDTEVIMITGYASVNGAVEAVKTGAEEYLPKPFTDEELYSAVGRALDKLRNRRASQAKAFLQSSERFDLMGESRPMWKVYDEISKAASADVTVLITGESGTGKELVARAIHYNSSRSSTPFVPVNCAGIPNGLLESELFGHVKGAFTGATVSRAGFFQTGEGGTVFLDEIGETPLPMQVKLLRFLQEKEIYMVGSTKAQKIDVRILAATNKDLHSLVKKGFFREDLFYRLNVIAIDLPPLRERGNDILLLLNHFTQKSSEKLGKPPIRYSDRVLQIFRETYWAGNVRELQNVVQRLVVMSEGEIIDALDLPSYMRFSAPSERGHDRTLASVEIEHIRNVLAGVDNNKTRAAEILGIDRKTLREKLKRYSLDE